MTTSTSFDTSAYIFECCCGERFNNVGAASVCKKCRSYSVWGYTKYVVNTETEEVVYGEMPTDEEYAAAEAAADEFDALVANTIASGAANREQAIRWLVEAEDVGHDMEFFVWKQGFLFTDRGRALTAELQKMMEAANA